MDLAVAEENSTKMKRKDHSSPSGIQDSNPPILPAKTTDASRLVLDISQTANQECEWQETSRNYHTADLGVAENRELQRTLSESGNLVVQGQPVNEGIKVPYHRLPHSWPGGSSSADKQTQQLAHLQTEHCLECRVLMEEISCDDTKLFWKNITLEEHNHQQICYCKYFGNFIKRLQDQFPQENGLNSRCTVNLLKLLLKEEQGGIPTGVTLANLVRVVKLFGPIRSENNSCVLVYQLHDIVKRSLKTRERGKKTKSSWFVGEMSREEAERNLLAEDFPNKTHLIRISGTDGNEGDFVLSVRHEDHCHHFKIQGNPQKALMETPYHSHLSFADRDFKCLSDVVDNITNNNEINIEQDPNDKDNETSCTSVICLRVFLKSPLNQTLSGYERARR